MIKEARAPDISRLSVADFLAQLSHIVSELSMRSPAAGWTGLLKGEMCLLLPAIQWLEDWSQRDAERRIFSTVDGLTLLSFYSRDPYVPEIWPEDAMSATFLLQFSERFDLHTQPQFSQDGDIRQDSFDYGRKIMDETPFQLGDPDRYWGILQFACQVTPYSGEKNTPTGR